MNARARRKWLGLAVLVIAALALAHVARWTLVRGAITAVFPAVRWVEPRELAADRGVILLDARSESERAVSELAGAIPIDTAHPSLTGVSRDRVIVVYCAVGWRSAAVADELGRQGYQHVSNLDGGIFRWVETGGTVVRGGQAVHEVHPFDVVWGLLLDDSYETWTARPSIE